MRKKSKAKWIGGGIFTGICFWLTQASCMELGGFDIEVGTGEGQEHPFDWREEPEEETQPETDEWVQEQNQTEDILTGDVGMEEEVPIENLPADTQGNSQSVPEQEVYQENQLGSENQLDNEGQPDSMTGSQTETPIKEKPPVQPSSEEISQTPVPSVSLTPSLTPILTPACTPDAASVSIQEASCPISLFQDFSVSFHHPSVPQNQENPYVEIQSKGQVGIVSVRHNHQECFWWREGKFLFLEIEPSEGKNKIEIVVITEDCRLVQMKPWIYRYKE